MFELSSELLTRLYKQLYLCRKAEDAIRKYYREDDMKTPMHMSYGEEAVPVGVCCAFGDRAQVFSSYRTHAAYLARTGDLQGFFKELYGKKSDIADGKAGSMHMSRPELGFMQSSAIVASTLPVAVGAAFANKYNGTDKIVIIFFGDGALDEGNFWESLNMACLWELPIVFVCMDNGYAVHTPKKLRQAYTKITDIVKQFKCSVVAQKLPKSLDPVEIYGLVEAYVSINVKMPVFLYLQTYRYLEHVGVNEDFNAGYRDRSEYDALVSQDSLTILRERLVLSLGQAFVVDIELNIDRDIEQAVSEAKMSEFSTVDDVYKGVFHEKN